MSLKVHQLHVHAIRVTQGSRGLGAEFSVQSTQQLAEGDDLAADTFWIGDLLNTWAENWMSYWTSGQGSFAMAEFEDAGIGQALQFLSQAGRADQNRLLVLRGGSDYTIQPQGETPAQFLASQSAHGLSGSREALTNLYQVGNIVVMQLSTNWNTYANQIPGRND